ncbi:BBP7 family outer membrane beta-barrel protein [Stieleria sp. JC731]|uniref:BBP7 family outer membrane beta-barrel protein n=1 Tax=Pirellulaceae TaxID=2691357 RepID=UPI001E52C6A1|nr:BBP7 family outer membrane beta-barrel protein [Stieleria sp. JC731]MCC9601136.1 BBP7 family outer membrane beta-barrel protein [Stieleria sp. JC731]
MNAAAEQNSAEQSNRVTWRPVRATKAGQKRAAAKNAGNATKNVQPAAYHPEITEYSDVVIDDSSFGSCDGYGCDAMGCDAMGGGMPRNRIRAPFSNLNYRIQADYLLWSLGGFDLPALVTTSPIGTSAATAGVLNQNGTTVLFGDEEVADDLRSGVRLTLQWDNRCESEGFDLSFTGIFDDNETFRDSRSLLARPVFDTGVGAESALLVSHPDFLSGSISASMESSLYAFDVMRRQRICTAFCDNLDLSFGYRHGRLDESLRMDQQSTFTQAQGPIVSGTSQSLSDLFETENRFHGAQFGLRYQSRYRNGLHLTANGKLAFGVNQAEARIRGTTTTTVPGSGSSTTTGGLLAQATNIGDYDQSDFTLIPEFGITLSTYFDRNLQIGIGYNVMVWTNAIQVEDTIDRNVSQFPPELPTGTQDPSFDFDSGTFVAHGLNFNAVFAF